LDNIFEKPFFFGALPMEIYAFSVLAANYGTIYLTCSPSCHGSQTKIEKPGQMASGHNQLSVSEKTCRKSMISLFSSEYHSA